MTNRSGAQTAPPDPLDRERRRLTNLAYRLLGSLSEAEDAVQEAGTRWYAMTPAQRQSIANPAAWLTTVTSRFCLNVLSSARARRERYVGEWIPEPVPGRGAWNDGRPGDGAADPADRVTLDESVGMAILVILESMTPAERVAFILHDVFCHTFAEVAEIIGRSPAACRQLASSARRRIRASRAPAAPAARNAAVIRDFKRAWDARDIDALVGLLDPGATAVADGGGAVGAVLHPVDGAEEIVRSLMRLESRLSELRILECSVNGQPGLLARRDGVVDSVYAFDVAGGRITRIWAVRNPDKLRAWTAGP